MASKTPMSSSFRSMDLRQILDNAIVEQKRDIQAYSWGHLNESRLVKVPHAETASRSNWSTSVARGRSCIHPASKQEFDVKQKPRATSVVLLPKKQFGSRALFSFSNNIRLRRLTDEQALLSDNDSDITISSTHVKIAADAEDVKLPTIMQQRPEHQCAKNDQEKTEKTSPVTERFLTPRHLQIATRSEEYHALKYFNDVVVHKTNAPRQDILHMTQSTERLTHKLNQHVKGGRCNDIYDRLKVHGDILAELALSSPTFHDILKTIQTEYDAYLSYLLSEKDEARRHESLCHAIGDLSARHDRDEIRIKREEDRIAALELKAQELIEVNQRLRAAVIQESAALAEPEPGPLERVANQDRFVPSQLLEQVAAATLEKLEAVNALRNRLSRDFVPITICNYLQQCHRETDVANQKLLSQKEYYEQSTAQLERELQDAVDAADTTEKDSRRIWRKLMLINPLNKRDSTTRLTDNGAQTQAIQSPDEEEESTKWNWYIS